jgi:hypothetical protein
MKTTRLMVTILALALLAGCKKENDLEKSVFLSDPEFKDLPAYSEWGYNTFGAYYDRQTFVSNDRLTPAKVMISGESMSFILDGQIGQDYYSYTEMTMIFKLSGLHYSQYGDLVELNDSIIDLKNPACQLSVLIDTTKYPTEILSGTMFFKRAQKLQVDKQAVETILSGYFEFRALIGGKPVTVSEGRFDVGIGLDNFFTVE